LDLNRNNTRKDSIKLASTAQDNPADGGCVDKERRSAAEQAIEIARFACLEYC
jgi:hypothetical protein